MAGLGTSSVFSDIETPSDRGTILVWGGESGTRGPKFKGVSLEPRSPEFRIYQPPKPIWPFAAGVGIAALLHNGHALRFVGNGTGPAGGGGGFMLKPCVLNLPEA